MLMYYQLCLHAQHFFDLCLYVLKRLVRANVRHSLLVMRNHLSRIM